MVPKRFVRKLKNTKNGAVMPTSRPGFASLVATNKNMSAPDSLLLTPNLRALHYTEVSPAALIEQPDYFF